jgi:hypothetical protein
MEVHKRTEPETYSPVTNVVMFAPVKLDDEDGDREDHTFRFRSRLCVCVRVNKLVCVDILK